MMSAPEHFPEFMTWEEYEQLPDEVAQQIELWDGRVVWMHRPTTGHQAFSRRLTNALERCARAEKRRDPERCRRVESDCNVFLGPSGRQDFLTPDFLIFQCPRSLDQPIRAADVELAGEVLSPGNTRRLVEAKKARYASAGIPWYWEVELAANAGQILTVQSFALASLTEALPAGVRPLHGPNYILVQQWSPDDEASVRGEQPFPFEIPWAELEL